jgi:hypothetical protein
LVVFLSKGVPSPMHDKKLAEELKMQISKSVTMGVDLGFQGLRMSKEVILEMPKKKPRKKELNEEDRQKNKEKAARRVIVEQVIGCCKILRTSKDTIRWHCDFRKNLVFETAVRLYNFKLCTNKGYQFPLKINSLELCS